jgi:hypothetical protein
VPRRLTVSTSVNSSPFHELLQFRYGVHHHAANLGERWAGSFPFAPPALECEYADAEECRRFLLANVSVANLLLCGWQSSKPSGHPASKLLDEFLFCQCGHCGTLLPKDARERDRDAILRGVDALLKATKFLLNLK